MERRRAPLEVLDKDGFEAQALGSAAFLHVVQDHRAAHIALLAGMLQSWIGLQALNNPRAIVLAIGGGLEPAREKLLAALPAALTAATPVEKCGLFGTSLPEKIAELEGASRPAVCNDSGGT